MLPRKESSFLSLDLFSFPHSIKQNSFKRPTLMVSYDDINQKALMKEENMRICI